jgi:aspartate/methionine/tyrosine aminotransferase
LLEKGDELIVMHPNYGTNIETPRAMGCDVKLWSITIENGFRPQIENLKKMVTSKTKLISITTPHNPTGIKISKSELLEIIEIAKSVDAYLLIDETYREIPFGEIEPSYVGEWNKIICVSSVSKAYGLPGLRIGWILTQDKNIMTQFLAAKEQIQICNSVIDEEIAFQYLLNRNQYLPKIRNHIATNYEILSSWLSQQQYFDYVLPQGGCVCFPKLKDAYDAALFYQKLNTDYGTFVGNGHWFEMSKQYMRIGFGWCSKDELIDGLNSIKKVLDLAF